MGMFVEEKTVHPNALTVIPIINMHIIVLFMLQDYMILRNFFYIDKCCHNLVLFLVYHIAQ